MDIEVPMEVAKPMTVYIWDMDETLILFKSLLDGTYAAAFDGLKDTRTGVEIGKRWENHILQVCDEHFFYEEIENYNEPFLDSLSEYDDGQDLSNYDFNKDGFCFPYDDSNKKKLAYRHRLIAQKYSQIYLFLVQKIEIVQGLWYRMHMLKLKLRSFYSSWEVGKLQCFSWIKERFGRRNVRFCAIGDGPEECEAAQAMRWPFIKIDLRPSSPHRFPGLNMKMVQSCIDVIYGAADADAEEVNE
ncbi:hypothetical protein GW17_00016306 [Ensete ventricosum]|nr:hypothetical protein GW17_00016306 [Ensete ventricosum]RZR87255.1 hypothetical protein BHM03_00014638 [Ensete ventricosum]